MQLHFPCTNKEVTVEMTEGSWALLLQGW